MLAREFADFRLGHVAQRKERAAQLLLREAEKKISLVLAVVGGALQQPTLSRLIISDASVMPGGDALGADLLRHNQQLIELQMIVAKTARDGRAAGEILLDERPHHVALKPLFVIDNVIGDTDLLRHSACVINIVERAAAPLYG